MPDPTTDTGNLDLATLLAQAQGLLGSTNVPPTVQMPQVAQPQGGDYGPPTSLLGRLGEALGGSAAAYVPMTVQQRNAQGARNLMDFFGGMAARPFGGPGEGIAEGVGRAEQSAYQPMVQTEALTKLANEQQQMQTERLKAMEPLLNTALALRKMQLGAGMPNFLLPGGVGGPPQLGGGAGPGGFPGAVKGAESGGNASATAPIDPKTGKPISSAAGPAQFIEGTWNDFLKSPQGTGFTTADRVAPPGADAATVARVQAANDAAVNWYAGVNNQAFQDKFGRQATPAELGSGHLLGTQGAIKLAQADPNAAVKDVLPANFISNNPHVLTPNMTVANARQSIGGFYGVGGAAGVVPATAPAPGRVQIAGPPSAVTQPPAAQPTPDQSQLPTPPVPPAGAPPSVTDRPTAIALARAIGQEVPVPGMQGDTAKPAGTVGPPGGGWLAPKAPAAQPAPPVATPQEAATPPAVTPPAAATPSPVVPPPPPAGGPSDTKTDDQRTYEEYRQVHAWAPTPAEMARWDAPAQALAPNIADAQKAKAQASVDYQYAKAQGDSNGMNAAVTGFNNANSDLARAVGSATSQGGQLAQDWQKNQEDILQKNYAQTKQLAQTAAENEKNRQAEINKIRVQAGTERDNKILDPINEQSRLAAARLDDLSLLKVASDQLGQGTLLTNTKLGEHSIADLLTGAGWGTKSLQDDASRAQAFQAMAQNTARALRSGGAGTNEPRSNQDLDFVIGMGPKAVETPETRNQIIGFLQMVNQRQMDYANQVNALTGSQKANGQPMSAAEALLEARRTMPPMIPQLPSGADAQRGFLANTPHNSWVRDPAGNPLFYH